MGRVILKIDNGRGQIELNSFKCKSEKRAKEIADSRPNCIEFNFYEDNQRVPQPKKKVKESKELTLEEMELMISKL